MAADDRQNVIARLQKYREMIEGLMELLSDKRTLSPGDKAKAQEQMKDLKEKLGNDHKAGATSRGEAELTKTERQFFQPAVTQALVELRSRWNSNPIASDWHSHLYAARIDINHYLRQLEKKKQTT